VPTVVRSLIRQLGPLSGVVLLLLCGVSHAQPRDVEAAAARLFEEGRRLAQQKRFPEACEKFSASYRLDPAAGTLFNLADCHERIGKLASARRGFGEVAEAARRLGDGKREQVARGRVARIEPRLCRLRIEVEGAAAGLAIQLDQVTVPAAEWGQPVPLDPGRHLVAAVAPGLPPWSRTLAGCGEGETVTVSVPALVAGSPARDQAQGIHGQRVGAIVAGAVGLVAVGIGTGLGVMAMSKRDDAAPFCPQPDACYPEGMELYDQARAAGNGSTAAFVLGAAALAGGAVLWLTAPTPGEPPAADTQPSVAGVRLGLGAGSFWLVGRLR
jgi:hypothetical protein